MILSLQSAAVPDAGPAADPVAVSNPTPELGPGGHGGPPLQDR